MFTGIVEETCTIRELSRKRGGLRMVIEGKKTSRRMKINDSIAVDGVCLTVVRKRGHRFEVQAVEETLRKTTLGRAQVSDKVNLERPMSASDRFGGHFVLGHIDGKGRIERIDKRKSSWMFWISFPRRNRRLLIPVGSVSVDGVSLTVADLKKDRFAVSIIPHTWRVTTFSRRKVGDAVNLEYDMLGKYIDQLIPRRRRGS